MKVTMIVGVPCVGKSTLVKRIMQTGTWSYRSPLYVPHHVSERLTILGRYDTPHQFPGTDRMSMAAQPHVLAWLDSCPTSALLFEGARLGNSSMVKHLKDRGFDFELVHLVTELAEIHERRVRERTQTDTFLKRAASQVRGAINAAEAYGVPVKEYIHTAPEHTAAIAADIWIRRT